MIDVTLTDERRAWRSDHPPPDAPAPGASRRRPMRAWPVTALFLLYPVWWALGLGTFIYLILALPMAVMLLRRRPVRLPPGFALWLLFLLWAVASVSMIGLNPPGTVHDSVASRIPAVALSLAEYAAVTVLLLYIGNATERELPRGRLIRLLGFMFVVTVAGGLLGVVAPALQFSSPVELLLPGAVRANLFVRSLVHPAAAQLQNVLGYPAPRPAAPFGYTNTWGNNLSVLLPWFTVGWLVYGSRIRRVTGIVLIGIAAVPAVYSINRGLWLALGLSGLYLLGRLLVRGSPWALGALLAIVAAVLLVVATPLFGIIQTRLAHPKSNDIRTFTTRHAIQVAGYSPVLGLGSTRASVGSHRSITVGRTSQCQRCGNASLGSNGQIWLVLVSQGYVGVALYTGFFGYALIRFRRDRTPIGMAGILVLLLVLFYMWIYNALVTPLSFYVLAIVLLWRNEEAGWTRPFPAPVRVPRR